MPTPSCGSTTPRSRTPTASTTSPGERAEPWLRRYGGLISSEWEFAKGLQLLEEDPRALRAGGPVVEAADWIIWQLTGRLRAQRVHRRLQGLHQDGRYPDRDFLAALNPAFAGFAEDKLAGPIGRLGDPAGQADRPGGGVDRPAGGHRGRSRQRRRPRHRSGGPGDRARSDGRDHGHLDLPRHEPRATWSRCRACAGWSTAGSSTGLFGYEAGQSGVGDIFAWYVENQVPARYAEEAAARGCSVHEPLTELGYREPVGAHGLVALDWHSGNRSVLVDHDLSGVVVGQTLATRAEQGYRALLEATAFGTRVIVETFAAAGVPVTELVVAGGLTQNARLMQTYADVLRLPISTIGSDQGPALGSAIHAAVAAGPTPTSARRPRPWARVRPVVVPPGRARRGARTTSSTPSTSSSTTCSGAAATT